MGAYSPLSGPVLSKAQGLGEGLGERAMGALTTVAVRAVHSERGTRTTFPTPAWIKSSPYSWRNILMACSPVQ
jgi:hypothetical protein